MSKKANVFDWDEDEESKKFEKNLIYGEQDEPDMAKDFLKKSLQAANMKVGSVDKEDDGGWKEEGRLGRILVGVVPNLLLCGNREGSVPLPSR